MFQTHVKGFMMLVRVFGSRCCVLLLLFICCGAYENFLNDFLFWNIKWVAFFFFKLTLKILQPNLRSILSVNGLNNASKKASEVFEIVFQVHVPEIC